MPNDLTSTDQCSICLEPLLFQDIGIPENCKHTFCFSCLVDWTEVRREIF